MRGSDSILPDRLEESLSCDDLFLEYFNVFLTLPSFPLRLRYDRLTGTFHEISKSGAVQDFVAASQRSNSLVSEFTNPDAVHGLFGEPPYGAKDDEKERVLVWALKNRLPLFYQSRLYREYKLLKLLLRPLDYRRGSSRIRGYSRLSMGTTATSFTPGDSPDEDNQSSVAWTDGQTLKKVSYLLGPLERSRPNSRTLSLPPDIGNRTWSATALYDTSATETSGSSQNAVASWQKRHSKQYRPDSEDENFRQNDMGVSDSGLGTTALDYATTIGTSAKTRNIGTRADTLGVGSRWESEYSTRTHTALTNASSFPGSGQLSGTSTPTMHSGTRYEGKSAMRTADTPSKPHRATIILPGSGNKTSVGMPDSSDATSKNRRPESSVYDADFETMADDDDIEDVDDFLEFDDRESSCDETEVEIESIQKVHQMKLQHIKDRLLGTKEGMDSFLNFMSETGGIGLISFWIDAEAFKDALERASEHDTDSSKNHDDVVSTVSGWSSATDEGTVLAWRHRLFRDILERHKFSLTEDASDQIREAQSNLGLTCHVFGRTQYDALRRLRSYWLPRYIVHCSTRADFEKRLSTGSWDRDTFTVEKVSDKRHTFLPLLTIGHFVPGVHLDKSRSEDGEPTVRPLETVGSGQQAPVERPSTARIRAMSAKSAAHHFLLKALDSEPDAGCPFRQYLIEKGDRSARNSYDLWITLEHLMEQSEPTTAGVVPDGSVVRANSDALDCNVEALDAWKIFSNLVWPVDAPKSINLPGNMHGYAKSLDVFLRRALSKRMGGKKVDLALSIFRPAKLQALYVLSHCWQAFCKDENKGFCEARDGKSLSSVGSERSPSPPRPQKPAKRPSRQFDEMSTTISETTTVFSKPWLTDDEDTETDSASTMYSYDVERIKQIAAIIRQRGAKKPQRSTQKRLPPPRRRVATAAKSVKSVTKEKEKKAADTASESSKTSKKKQTKVQFSLPERTDSQNTSRANEHESVESRTEEGEDDEGGKKRKKKKSLFHRHPNRMSYQELKDNKLHLYFRRYVAQCESMEVQNVYQMYGLCDVIKTLPMTEVTRRTALANELARTYLNSSGPKQIAVSSEILTPFFKELPNPSAELIEALQAYVVPTLNQAAANFSLGFSAALKEYKLDLRSDLAANNMKAELALRTLTLKPSSKRRKALGKHSARQQPSAEHKQSFLDALDRATEGSLPVDLLHFYKYLQGFGNQEGFPLIHNDLLFYVEVSKFLACFHEAHDLVILKRKVQSIVDCFITSAMEPTLQIDIKTGTAERLRRASESFVNDKGRDPHTADLFEDAQHTVFNELLPFWAGFASVSPLAERDGKKPVLKAERLQRRRLDAFIKAPDPKTTFNIPKSIPKFDMHGIEFTFSVNGGIQWKEWSEISSSRSSSPPPEGIIEIVKMPPKSQSRRLVRRGTFSVKKLNAIHENASPQSGRNSSTEKSRADKNKKNAAKHMRGRNFVPNVNYATSVS